MAGPPFSKPTISQLKSLIDVVLNSIKVSSAVYLNRNTVDAAYAGYVFGLILRAVDRVADPKTVHLSSALAGTNKANPQVFVIRGSPGPLNAGTQDFGFATFEHRGTRYEIHLGAQFQGSSGVLHEFDISIIPGKDASKCRNSGKPPGPSSACAVFECKCYTKYLGIELGREFVGLKADFTSVPMARLVTNSQSDSVARFLRKTSRPKLTYRLDPNNSAMEQEFIYAVADELRNTL